MTVEQWWKQYDSATVRRASTQARDRHVMRRWWLPEVGSQRLATVTPADIRGVLRAMTDKGLAPATIRTNYGVVRAMFASAVAAEKIIRSPCRGIRLMPDEYAERRTLGPEELARLAGCMTDDYRPMVYVAGVLGLRWSEVVALRVCDVDFMRQTLTVSRAAPEVDGTPILGRPKSRAGARTLAVPAFVIEMLVAHLNGCGRRELDALLFAAPGGGILRGSTFRTRIWRPAVERATLSGLRFHDLRHVATSLMVDAGLHPRTIQHRLGHSDPRMSLGLYAHVSDETDRDAAARLARRFQDVPEGSSRWPANA
jgi:integrase